VKKAVKNDGKRSEREKRRQPKTVLKKTRRCGKQSVGESKTKKLKPSETEARQSKRGLTAKEKPRENKTPLKKTGREKSQANKPKKK